MKKIYEAFGENKRELIKENNNYHAFRKARFSRDFITINDIIMIGKATVHDLSNIENVHWYLNGFIVDNENDDEIVILEPFVEQYNKGNLRNISEENTYFEGPIKLSEKSIILMSINKFNKLSENDKKLIKEKDVRLYEGEKDLAIRMVLEDKNYIVLDITNNGYKFDKEKNSDTMLYGTILTQIQKKASIKLGENVTYKKDDKKYNQIIDLKKNKYKEELDNLEKEKKRNNKDYNYKMITGLTEIVEGDIGLDEEVYATTNIGKVRENQEDAVLLIKDNLNPKLKMLVVADGVGGQKYGEIASNVIIREFKKWFENLPQELKKAAFESTEKIKKSLLIEIENTIHTKVLDATGCYGASTLVCAIIGKNDTIISNVGDSRAYITKKGKLMQVSREDTYVQEELEKGNVINKEASRFHRDSNQITQCIGMNKHGLKHPYVEIINNKDYEMLLLFTDGVTDCLSDEDIAIVCRTTDKKKLANKIVEKAIRHDSILDEKYIDENNLSIYISGGKDNTTAAVYLNKEREEDER